MAQSQGGTTVEQDTTNNICEFGPLNELACIPDDYDPDNYDENEATTQLPSAARIQKKRQNGELYDDDAPTIPTVQKSPTDTQDSEADKYEYINPDELKEDRYTDELDPRSALSTQSNDDAEPVATTDNTEETVAADAAPDTTDDNKQTALTDW